MGKIVGEKQIKENARSDFYKMIKESWTYAKLTDKEKEQLLKVMFSVQTGNAMKGTYDQRWQILQAIYHSFLMALDYKPTNWREEEDIPLF